ncbi:hypothetical protein SAMN06297144_3273 [Sphingomonas guangdongensis]|uniref:Cell pole-organizing protein PopZ n=1 Tax=Sphingomonas guangdongensis TaxID=1141890 RepID=A0A285R6X7_9SPHN|nr:DUF2497 domain-containing protein [Sphingomonas guangdongensis]SOB88132.1 hypothetical protein SAMN06297144_3273 [Sphingomonas guangdongensis]
MGDVSNEPTMEEILSSIKRVIEESESAPGAARPRRPGKSAVRDSADEVLELNERVPFPAVAPTPRAIVRDPVDETPPPAAYEPESRPQPEPAREQPAPATPPVAGADGILSPSTAEVSRGSLEALSRLIVKPDLAGSDTLEGLVRELLRPMLREWLDQNLPGIVETMVAREIARISGR